MPVKIYWLPHFENTSRLGIMARPRGNVKEGQKLFIEYHRDSGYIKLYPWAKADNFRLQNELVLFLVNIRQSGWDKTTGYLNWRSSFFDVEVSADGIFFVSWDMLMEKIGQKATEIEERFALIKKDNAEKRIAPIQRYRKFIASEIKRKKELFICYSHQDIALKNELKLYLQTLLSKGIISIWDDEKIQTGDEWDKKIKEGLDRADISVLLISQQLIASTYVNEVEIRIILEKKLKENCKLVPVLVRPCDWMNWEVFLKDVQFLPLNVKRQIRPVTKRKDRSEAWLQVTDTIREICD
jgi:hypothetical protein